MTKAEAIEKVLQANGGIATWELIYNQLDQFYPTIKSSPTWQAGIRGVLYRDIRNNKRFKMLDEGIVSLRDYDERQLALAEDLQGPTQLTVWASVRRGQQKFRTKLLQTLAKRCPVTGINDERLLLASHIKPWALATDAERLDVNNGFLFSPLIDKLFDRGFISFENDRSLQVSPQLSAQVRTIIGLKSGVIYPALQVQQRESYLAYHRENVFHS